MTVSTLTVWRCPSAGRAVQPEPAVGTLRPQELIDVHHAAVVSWDEGKKGPTSGRVPAAFARQPMALVETNLSSEQDARLCQAFSEE